MRFVDRTKVLKPQILEPKTNPKINEEINEAKKHYLKIHELKQKNQPIPKVVKKQFFSIYKNKEVKEALVQLFYGKCAYCEGRYAAFHPVDIEHWRPKAEVITDEEGKERRYGYYWLAADWDNLLPSCIFCNRVNNLYDCLQKKDTTMGKGNWFPLKEGGLHAATPDDVVNEIPLLLNPCIHNPDDYLCFDEEEGVVRPKLDNSNQPKPEAIESLRFYALNRRDLVVERLSLIKLINKRIKSIERLTNTLTQSTLSLKETRRLKSLLREEFNELDEFKQEDQQFSTMAKQVIPKLLEKVREKIEATDQEKSRSNVV